MFERFTKTVTEAWSQTAEAASQLITPTVRLGVTGLARSGKTVFITSLVHNLIHRGRLPFFQPFAQGRFLRAYLDPQPDDAVPRFDYEGNLAMLTAPEPVWPDSTRAISQLRLTIEYEPIGTLWRSLGVSKMHLDIVDYPGEWLLDLPLLSMTFEDWSAKAIALARQPFRAGEAQPWLEFLGRQKADAPQNEAVARQGAELFTAYLARCRQDALSLSSLTPGRFLLPGDLAGSPAVTFFPLELQSGSILPRDSLGAMMTRRFEAYKTHAVKPFFRDHFARLNRQIVLADVLTVLNAGPNAVEDLERALSEILECFKQGENGWTTYFTGRRIDRIVFAATKADHLHHANHDRLEAILKLVTAQSMARAAFAGANVDACAIASIRSTREATVKQNGETLLCIAGVPLKGEQVDGRTFNGREELAIFPGDLPVDPNLALSPTWMQDGRAPLHFVRFRPPSQPAPEFGKTVALPHTRLDRALNFLLADKLS